LANHTLNSCIYVILNTKNGHIYIGQAQDLRRRWDCHKRQLKGGYHDNDHLQKAWNKYGARSFKFKVLEYCSIDQLDIREQHFLDIYMAKGICYNISKDARAPMRGRSLSVDARKKLRIANKGRSPAMKGKKHTEETRRKMSVSASGKVRSPEHCQNLSNAKKGKPKSAEHRRKLSEANMGKPSPRKGQKASEETRRKISEAKKGKAYHKKSCTWNGIEYSSITEAAIACGVGKDTVSLRIKRGCVCDADIQDERARFLQRKRKA